MIVSVGLILHDKESLLLCHATGQKHWDIPKGIALAGEPLSYACAREIKEETGLVLEPYFSKLYDVGRYDYKKGKKLHLFSLYLKKLPSIDTLECSSFFTRHGKKLPEMDKYCYTSIGDIEDFVVPNLAKAVKEAWRKILKQGDV
jgi:putative (di)nucleoside polyphosphate hydrolase